MSRLPTVRPWLKPLRLTDANRPRIPVPKPSAPCGACGRLADCLAHHDDACSDLRAWRAEVRPEPAGA